MNMNKIVFSGLEEYSPEDLFRRLPSPSYVIDETQLECRLLSLGGGRTDRVQSITGSESIF